MMGLEIMLHYVVARSNFKLTRLEKKGIQFRVVVQFAVLPPFHPDRVCKSQAGKPVFHPREKRKPTPSLFAPKRSLFTPESSLFMLQFRFSHPNVRFSHPNALPGRGSRGVKEKRLPGLARS
jgi:hypothetical protein